MSLELSWAEIALRLLLTVAASVLIGYDRSEHGKAAGMRTTLLVCLAAAVAMIQVNLLLPTAGKPSDSFITNDLMRLPLGILTGVGFIGGGAILRRDDIVVGVTTAATLWLVTVVGLCFGGGQLGLGIVASALGIFALQGLRWLESRLRQQIRTRLTVVIADNGLSESALRQRLSAAGLSVAGTRIIHNPSAGYRELIFELRQLRMAHDTATPPVVADLVHEAGVVTLRWDALR
jgi:putative Mg2+ transporter-C (MgtC) family protein